MFRTLCHWNTRYIARQCTSLKRLLPQTCVSARQYSIYEPDYLDIKPEIPLHETLNVSLRGYDFAVLESFAKYVHQLANSLSLDTEAFPVPARTSRVQILKSTGQVETEYNLELYERVIQIDGLKSTLAPTLFEVLQLNTPAGIQVSVKPPTPEEEEFRYVPDLTLLELKSQIAELEKAKEDRKKK
jgi:large subunit ribosomal protein L48